MKRETYSQFGVTIPPHSAQVLQLCPVIIRRANRPVVGVLGIRFPRWLELPSSHWHTPECPEIAQNRWGLQLGLDRSLFDIFSNFLNQKNYFLVSRLSTIEPCQRRFWLARISQSAHRFMKSPDEWDMLIRQSGSNLAEKPSCSTSASLGAHTPAWQHRGTETLVDLYTV